MGSFGILDALILLAVTLEAALIVWLIVMVVRLLKRK